MCGNEEHPPKLGSRSRSWTRVKVHLRKDCSENPKTLLVVPDNLKRLLSAYSLQSSYLFNVLAALQMGVADENLL